MGPIKRLCSRLTALWRYINFVLLLLLLLLNTNKLSRADIFNRPIHSKCQTPSKTQTNKFTKRHLRFFVYLFVRCVCQGRPSYGWANRDDSQKFNGGRDKNPGSTNRYTNFGQLINRKIIKILPPHVTF